MGKKKIFLMVLLGLLLLLSLGLGIFWHMQHYVVVEFQFYPRGAAQLDLRDREISVSHYETLRRRMPECEIQWNVPFQGRSVSWDTREITITALTQQDIRVLKCFTGLQRVVAEDCTDYENLLILQKQRPDLQVEYTVGLGSETYAWDAEQVVLEAVSPEEISLLACLPELRSVLCSGGAPETIAQLQEYCREHQLEFRISLGGKELPPDAETVTAEAVTEEQISLLQFFPDLKQLHLRRPKASAQKLLELKQSRPDVKITWEAEVFGKLLSSDIKEADFSGMQITSLDALEQQMAYFPDVQQVFLGECGLDNEMLAALRDRVRDQYKLVWTVSCGSKLKTRTDATTFMPVRENVYYFNDEEAYNLRYCEDMVCIDIGHMSISKIDFVKTMPNLQYLVLAHTQVQYIEPIRTCKNLKFLELDWSPIRDLAPLKDCTALEDLNLGNTFADFTPVGEMSWLKNLWMVGCSTGSRYRMTQALPDTKVMVTGSATVANGWRDLENYYEMRDLLGMHYMSW